MTITPIEETYALINRYGLHYPSSDAERVDGLTYAWQKLGTQVGFCAGYSKQRNTRAGLFT